MLKVFGPINYIACPTIDSLSTTAGYSFRYAAGECG